MLAAGLVAALLSVFLDWISAGSAGAGPLDDNARFRLGDWLETDKLDGYAVLLLSAAGLAALVFGRVARRGQPSQRFLSFVPAIAGSLLTAVGLLEYQFIQSQWKDLDVDTGIGVYILLLGGLAAAVSRFVPEKAVGQA